MLKLQKGVFSQFVIASVVLLAISLGAFAQEEATADFAVSINAVNNAIFLDGQAVFELTITNQLSYAESFRISVQEVEWSVQSDPLYHYFSGVDIPAQGSQTVRLLLKPAVAFPPGLRAVNLAVQSVKGRQSQDIATFVNIRSKHQLIMEYLAAVSRIVEIPSQIDPRNEFEIKVNLINRNPKNISELKIALTSVSSSLINEEIVTSLRPLESKEVSTKVKLDPLSEPTKDTLRVVIFIGDKQLEPTIFEKFEVISYSEIRPVRSVKNGFFFRSVNETVYVNDGNVRSQKVVEQRTNILKPFFTKSAPDSFTISRGGSRYLAWEIALEPQEEVTVRVVESYRAVTYLLLLGLLALLAYRFFQSPVQMIKEASAISYKEGGVSELKVILRIRNRSSQPYVKLTVMDRVPMIAEVEHDSMGTMKPATVFNDGRGSVVKWELESIDRHEERILAYKIRSKLSILGTFVLPKGSVRFYTEKNVKFVTHSNKVTIKP